MLLRNAAGFIYFNLRKKIVFILEVLKIGQNVLENISFRFGKFVFCLLKKCQVLLKNINKE